MIPTSPNITYETQEYIIETIKKYNFYLKNNLNIININKENKYILKNYISTINNKYFRYFNKRNEDIIENHLITILIKNNNDDIIGYSHIDYDSDKYWFGIYLNNNYRGKGYGNDIINYIKNHYLLKSINEIYLSVDIDNEYAIKLYKKNGFIEYFRNSNYILMSNKLV